MDRVAERHKDRAREDKASPREEVHTRPDAAVADSIVAAVAAVRSNPDSSVVVVAVRKGAVVVEVDSHLAEEDKASLIYIC